MTKITCISDLHGEYPETTGGDLLIIAGDIAGKDTISEYLQFRDWIKKQNYEKKVFISGNHDNLLYKGDFYFNDLWMGADFLNDSGCQYKGLKIWGSPWTSKFQGQNPSCCAYTRWHDDDLKRKFRKIPEEIDILITHSPPYGILDKVTDKYESNSNLRVGSKCLLEIVKTIKPKLHIFGHIHESHGLQVINNTTFVNASYMNEVYDPINKPINIEI